MDVARKKFKFIPPPFLSYPPNQLDFVLRKCWVNVPWPLDLNVRICLALATKINCSPVNNGVRICDKKFYYIVSYMPFLFIHLWINLTAKNHTQISPLLPTLPVPPTWKGWMPTWWRVQVEWDPSQYGLFPPQNADKHHKTIRHLATGWMIRETTFCAPRESGCKN